jgi:ribosomal protein S12 methylthiotransferase accessory factor YcaO
MIKEASSTMFEFLATGKTGIIFDLDSKGLKHSDGMPLLDENNRTFLEGAFVHFHNPSAVRSAIYEALDNNLKREELKRTAQKHLFFKLDGNASKRIKTIVEDLLNDETSRNVPE